MDKASNL